MSTWESYPTHYRSRDIQKILNGIRAGECVSLIGLSGAGKSNLLGFLASRQEIYAPAPHLTLVDCNRLEDFTITAMHSLIRQSLEESSAGQSVVNSQANPANWIEAFIKGIEKDTSGLCLMIDRFDVLIEAAQPEAIFGNLRAMRDRHKYWLTFLVSTRSPLDTHNELAELCYAHTIWLGPLSQEDARWNVIRYAERIGQIWDDNIIEAIIQMSWGYPSFLRGICEAYASGIPLELNALREHSSLDRRLREFWDDLPDDAAIRYSGLEGHPFVTSRSADHTDLQVDEAQLTAKENLLLKYLRSHPGEVCEKDELIRAVWPEDKVYLDGIRDDSLAQIVRRLRVKIEPNPTEPIYIQTIPGRGYRFIRQV